MARPTKLTEELIANIAHGVQRGARPEVVAQAFGVGRSTYYSWIDHGRKPGPGDHLPVMLVEEIDRARGIAKLYLIDKIAKSTDWRAAAKLLEIIDPDWARAAGALGTDDQGGAPAPTIQIIVEGKIPRAQREASDLTAGGNGPAEIGGDISPDNGYQEDSHA